MSERFMPLLLVMGACLATARPARAQRVGEGAAGELPAAAGPRLEWRAPAECPGREEVLSHVSALARASEMSWSRFERVVGEVRRDGDRWSLAIAFVGPGGSRRRDMTSGRCDELAEAAAVAIVLASRSDVGSDWSDAPTAPEEASDAAGGVADEPSAASAASLVPAAPEAPGEPLSLTLGAEALLDPTTLGSMAIGAGAGLDVGRGRLSGGLYGALLPAVETALGGGQAVALGLWTGGARGCLRWGRALDTCAHVELGRVSSAGVGLEQASRQRELWAAPGLSAAFTSSPFDGFGVTTRVSLYHPLVRGRYRVDERDVVHQIPPLTFRIALGAAVPLF